MDTAAFTATNTLYLLSSPAAQRPILSWPTTTASSRSNIRHFCACNYSFLNKTTQNPYHRNRNTAGFSLTHCSTKPNIDRDSAIEPNPTNDPNCSSETQNPAIPTSNQAISSSNSSFSRGLVFDLGPQNSWDSADIGSPVVKRYLGDEEQRWHMWYHGRSGPKSGSDSIGLAVSSNGIHWDRGTRNAQSSSDVGMVMNCGKDWWGFDTQNVRPSEVVIMSSAKVKFNNAVYWLYYTGSSSENVEILHNPERVHVNDGEINKIFKSLPGLAMSQDGRHWARIEGDHHSGALLDVGSNGEWDSLFIASPHVVFHASGDLRMYYHSYDAENGHFAIGIARSRDGINWVKLGKIIGGGANGSFDEYGAMNACVVRSNRKDGKYVMVYEGVGADGGRSIGVAVSADGLKHWQRVEDGEVALKASEGDRWDNRGVGSPCLVQMDGDAEEWRLYYRGIGKDGRMGIGMAVSEGNEIGKFTRWTGFNL